MESTFTIVVRDVNGNTLGRLELEGELVDTYDRGLRAVGSNAVESVSLNDAGDVLAVTVELDDREAYQ